MQSACSNDRILQIALPGVRGWSVTRVRPRARAAIPPARAQLCCRVSPVRSRCREFRNQTACRETRKRRLSLPERSTAQTHHTKKKKKTTKPQTTNTTTKPNQKDREG